MNKRTSEPVPEPVVCSFCGTPLPIALSHAPEAVSLECAFCQALYRGIVWPIVPEHLAGNVRIAGGAGGSV